MHPGTHTQGPYSEFNMEPETHNYHVTYVHKQTCYNSEQAPLCRHGMPGAHLLVLTPAEPDTGGIPHPCARYHQIASYAKVPDIKGSLEGVWKFGAARLLDVDGERGDVGVS